MNLPVQTVTEVRWMGMKAGPFTFGFYDVFTDLEPEGRGVLPQRSQRLPQEGDQIVIRDGCYDFVSGDEGNAA